MQFRPQTDLSGLAHGAQAHGRDPRARDTRSARLRADLLLAQVDLFAGASSRGGETVATFETLMLGLIPLVDPGTLARAAERLGPIAETPPSVAAALAAARPASPADSVLLGRLDGHRLRQLVELARHDADLARWLLARAEPTVFDRAALYRFASPEQRSSIRRGLHARVAPARPVEAALGPGMRSRLLEGRDAIGLARVMAGREIGPSPEAVEGGLADAAEQELYALALVALGFAPDECIRLVLALPPAVSHSIAAVERLARIVRTTSPATALALVDPDGRVAALTGQRRPAAAYEAARENVLRQARGVMLAAPDRSHPRREASDLPGRRSRSTTGPSRT